jgi:hypothetical protein
MDRILKVENNEAKLAREELELIPEFKTLLSLAYNKDKGDIDGRKRFRAIKELTYIWFMYSNSSPYREYDEKERKIESLQTATLPPNYPISTDLLAAIEKYKKLTDTRVLKLIRAAEKAIDRLREYFETVNFTERNSAGTLVNKPSEVISAISQLDKVSEGLERLATRQKAEKNQFVDARGTQESGWLMEQDKLNGTRTNTTTEDD